MSRRAAEPVELARLRGWLRAAKGRRTFAALARRADARKLPVSVCTLRRSLDGRLPTLRTVQAFARGAGADEEEGARVWAVAAAAVRPEPVRKPAGYVPGRGITTLAGLAAAVEKVRAAVVRADPGSREGQHAVVVAFPPGLGQLRLDVRDGDCCGIG
ncbi:hypothetical protein ACF1AE_33450 [Streptomyces sp. NPDC014986]|uniref:hypothetical protein n=1 Tax=Streptomyces sp. NPDC014986 TaxID=3364934 RepID=UPI0037015CAB